MNAKELAVTGLWLASIVEVFGSTWEAFKQTYQPFPIGGAAQPAPINPGFNQPLPGTPKAKTGPKAGQFLSPPDRLIQPVVQAVQEGAGTRALAAWTKVLAWANGPQAKAQGWDTSKLVDWAVGQGWFGRFYDITGWTPGGLSNAGRPTTKKGPIN